MKRTALFVLLATLVASQCGACRQIDKLDPLAPRYRKYESPHAAPGKAMSESEVTARRKQYVDVIEQTLPMKEVVWQLVLPNVVLRRTTLQGDAMYVETDAGSVYAIERETGKCRWQYDADMRPDFPPGQVGGVTQEIAKQTNAVKELEGQLANEKNKKDKDKAKIATQVGKLDEARTALATTNEKDVTYILVGDRLHCFDRIFGAHRWSMEIPFASNAAPIGAVGYFFVVSLPGNRVYSYAFDTMREFAMYNAQGNICAPPIFEMPSLYFASEDGIIYSYDVGGKLNWTYRTEKAVRAPLVVSGNVLYACSTDYAAYAFDRVTGNVLWKFEAGYAITKKPELHNGILYVAPDDKSVYAVDIGNGHMLWKVPRAERFVVGTKRRAYLLGASDEILCVDPKTGDIRSRHPLGPFKFVPSNTDGPIMFMATQDGFIFALAESDTKF